MSNEKDREKKEGSEFDITFPKWFKHISIFIALTITSLLASPISYLVMNWVGIVIFVISLIGIAYSGRPTDPIDTSWDLGMGDDLRQTGKTIPTKNAEQNSMKNNMQRYSLAPSL